MTTQPKNLLNNSFVQIGIVVAICGILLCWFVIPHSGGATASADTSATSYDALRGEIKKYSVAAQWNEIGYNAICKTIENSLTNNKINVDQKKELDGLALSEYVITLKKAIDEYLPTAGAGSGTQLSAFLGAVNRLGSTDLKGLTTGIWAFRRVVAFRTQVENYTSKEMYDALSTESLKLKIDQAMTFNIIAKNVYLNKLRQRYKEKLEKHKEIDDYFKIKEPSINAGKMVDCALFKDYKYYYTICTAGPPVKK